MLSEPGQVPASVRRSHASVAKELVYWRPMRVLSVREPTPGEITEGIRDLHDQVVELIPLPVGWLAVLRIYTEEERDRLRADVSPPPEEDIKEVVSGFVLEPCPGGEGGCEDCREGGLN